MQQRSTRSPRMVASRPALVSIGDKGHVSCIIRNISARGACISPLGQYPSANEFELQDKFTQERWKARVVWRGVGKLGLELSGHTPRVLSGNHGTFGKR